MVAICIIYCFVVLAVATPIDSPEIVQFFSDVQRENPFDPRLVHHFYANGTVIRENFTDITLTACNDQCGVGWTPYPTSDIQRRIATWQIPLFLLIGSMHYASFGFWNTVFVIIHLLGDPVSSFESLLSKLRRLQKHHDICVGELSALPRHVQKAVAMILAAYEEWDHEIPVYSEKLSAKYKGEHYEYAKLEDEAEEMEQNPDMFHILNEWLGSSTEVLNPKLVQRRCAYLQAANEMSDCRDSGFSKTLLGVINYITVVAASFVHVAAGEFNNRTGHSIAMSMLFSWLIPTIFLCSLVGGFATKRSSEDVLERLYQRFKVIEDKNFDIGGKSSNAIPAISRISGGSDHADPLTYDSLEWSGGNYTFRPRQSCWGERKLWTSCVAHLPVICSTLIAFGISYTSPTAGVGCRSVLQLFYGISWISSAWITRLIIQKIDSAYCQWLYTRIKDLVVFLAQAVTFFLVFGGWFNSCFCWSAWFSLRGKAHVLLSPSSVIQSLAGTKWLGLTLSSILGQLFLVACIWAYFRKGAALFHVSDEDRRGERWEKPPRIRTIPRVGTLGLGAVFSGKKNV